jgi:hypothetical protein
MVAKFDLLYLHYPGGQFHHYTTFSIHILKWLKIHDNHVMQMVLNTMAIDNMDHFNYSYDVILN